ncbi:MAG: cysteine-rich KTR domain-containing protein [Candidatus Ventricola sp.]
MSQQTSKWLCCPICGAKTRTKVFEDTLMINFPLYCRKCKRDCRRYCPKTYHDQKSMNGEPADDKAGSLSKSANLQKLRRRRAFFHKGRLRVIYRHIFFAAD